MRKIACISCADGKLALPTGQWMVAVRIVLAHIVRSGLACSMDKRALAGHTFDTISEAAFATFPLAQMVEYEVVYFEPSWGSYDNLRANMGAMREYVERGGVAVVNIAGNIGTALDIDPLGTDYDRSQVHDAEAIQLPDHDYITGAPFGGTPLTAADFNSWNRTDHGWLTGFPESSEVALRNTAGASWLGYRLRRGEVIVTTLTYGWGCCGARGAPLSNLAEYSLFLPVGVSFMSVEPEVGSVAPGQSVTLTVTFDSTELEPGSHLAEIVIASNDPDENPTITTGSLTAPPPDIEVSLASFTLTQDRNQVTTADLTITNTGDGTMVFDSTAYVGTNGMLGFSSSGMSSLSNRLLPDPGAPNKPGIGVLGRPSGAGFEPVVVRGGGASAEPEAGGGVVKGKGVWELRSVAHV